MEKLVGNRYFDITQDFIVIKDGGFFCQACLSGLPLTEQSEKDSRYCKFCQPLIEQDYALLAEHKGKPLSSYYKPVAPKKDVVVDSVLDYEYRDEEVLAHRELGKAHECQNLATEKPVLVNFGGRPLLDLPEDLIRELLDNGLGVSDILRELKGRDIKVSRRTLYRILAGQRALAKSG